MNLDILIPAISTIVGAILGGLIPFIINKIGSKNKQLYKFLYVKMYHLKKRKQHTEPVYKQYIERLKKEIDIFDEFHYFKLNIFRHKQKRIIIQDRSSGVVDMQILHPWQKLSFSDIGASQNEGFIEQIVKQQSTAIFTKSMYYNGFQKNNENFGAIMEKDTDEIRMVIDFSAISGHEEIITNAIGAIRKDEIEEPLGVAEPYSGVYVINTRKLEKGNVLRVDFSINWDHPLLNN